MRYMIIIAVLVSLTGCSGYDLNSLPVNSENASEMANLVRMASETKEAIYYDAVKNRDEVYKDMYAHQGFQLKWDISEQVINGVKVYIPLPEVSYKAPPVFPQSLPAGPSKHPVWQSIDNFVNKGVQAIFGWFVYDGAKELWKRSAPQYNGPYTYSPSTSTSTTQVVP